MSLIVLQDSFVSVDFCRSTDGSRFILYRLQIHQIVSFELELVQQHLLLITNKYDFILKVILE